MVPVSKLNRRNEIVSYSTCFQFYVLLFKIICLKFGKIQFKVQGVTHNPVPWVKNIDFKDFFNMQCTQDLIQETANETD